VRNLIGGGGQAGAEQAAHGAPDGLMLIIANIAVLAFHPHLFARIGYDPLRDFAPVGVIGENPMVLLASRASGITGLSQLRMRTNEGRLSIGSAGRGSALHMAARMLMQALGGGGEIVTYSGGGPALEDLQAGTLDVMADQAITAIPATHSGVRALAVLGPQRLPEIATVPTAAELGLPIPELAVWNVLAAPSGTPPHIIHALAEALEATLEDEMLAERFASLSVVTPQGAERGPVAAAALIGAEHARWGRYIRQAGMEREG
jgi:tripartite-type tricarboxylate transporter receptor subunit TctC